MARREIMDGTDAVEVEGYTGRVKVAVEGDEIVAVICTAFALCTNEATTTIANRILGDVPACERCKARLEALAR